jgi:3-dehydro-L-gulonate 2-dehydrogenase
VLDMAMSLFSYGKMENYALQGKRLPMPGGFDLNGNLTDDPAAILEAKHPVAIGYWKGTGLSLMLDLIGIILSGGDSSMDIGKKESEYGVTQVFLAFDPSIFPDSEKIQSEVLSIVDALHSLAPSEKGGKAYYPGERTLLTRIENTEKGIPVDSKVWQSVCRM